VDRLRVAQARAERPTARQALGRREAQPVLMEQIELGRDRRIDLGLFARTFLHRSPLQTWYSLHHPRFFAVPSLFPPRLLDLQSEVWMNAR
jgi:hypothetical protein